MDFSSFTGEEFFHQDQYNVQYKPHEVCWCRGSNNLVEVIQDLKSSLRSLIREEVDEVVRKIILPHLSSAPTSTSPAISRSLPHQTEPSASKRLYLRINDTSLPETLFTMNKIRHQVDSLKVELVDDFGSIVENDPESSTKIRMVVLNGDFEVEDNDWSEDDFNKNLVRPRKDKASSLLKGKCEISLNRGVADVVDISFTDNSKRHGTFRLGAQVMKSSHGVNIKSAASKPFTVKERRLLADQKHEKPSLEDELWRLKNIRKDGPVYERAKKANICTVKDFLQLLQTDPKTLQNILGVSETKWKDIVENAEACVLTNELYKYYDGTSRVELVLNCAFNIVSVTFMGQISQLYGSLNDHQKQVVNETRRAAYKNPKDLKPYTPAHKMQNQAELSRIYRIPSINMRHHEVTPMQIQARVSCVPGMPSMYMHQHPDATLVQQGEDVVQAYSYLHGPSSYHFDQENPASETYEGQLQDNPEEWTEQMIAELINSPKAPTENNPTSKLIAACYVTKAATMFMVSIKQDHIPLKKKQKFY